MLEILGIIFLAIIVIVVLVVGFFVYKIARQAGSYQKAAAIMEAFPQETITLRQIDNPPWNNPDQIDYNKLQLENHGFTFLNSYTIPEFGGVRLMAFTHHKTNVEAAVYEHPEVSVWVDIFVPYQDGSSLTVSSVAEQGQLSRPEEHKMIARAGEDVNILLSILEENIEDKAVKPVTAETFASSFEDHYEAEMKWRKQQGYFNDEDLHKMAKSAGVKLSKQDIEAARMIMNDNEDDYYKIEEECMSAFATRTKLNVAQWEKVRDRLFIILDNMSNDEVIDLVLEHADVGDDEIEEAFYKYEESTLPARELFEFLNNKLPEAKRINKLDDISEPHTADLYFSNITEY